MNSIDKYRKTWLRYLKGYERQSYRIIKRAFNTWGSNIPFNRLDRYNYEFILSQYVDLNVMNEAYMQVYDNIGSTQGKRTGKLFNESVKFFEINVFDSAWQEAVDWFFRQYGISRVKTIHTTYQADIVKLIQTRLAEGKDMRETIQEVQRIVQNRNYYRWQAFRVARTESTASANYGALIAGRTTGFLTEKMWVSAQDARTRGFDPKDKNDHYSLNGVRVPYDGVFVTENNGIIASENMLFPGDPTASVGNVVNCYLPDTIIQSNIIEGQRSFYSGKAVEIVTRRGERLSITANHGILTEQGFISAKDIQVGDNLVCNRVHKNRILRLVNNYIQKKVFTAENIFSSLSMLWGSKQVVVTALDFDGDGKSMHGNIDIVNPKVKLRNGFVSKLVKAFNYFKFKATNLKIIDIRRFGSFNFFSRRNNSATSRFMSFLYLSFPLCFRHFRPLNTFRLGLSSQINSKRFKSSSDSGSRDSKFLRELINTDSAMIAFDDVVEVRYFDFSGHVYDFSSVNGVNIANNIYTSNCRCSLAVVPARDADGNLIRTRPQQLAI